MTKITKAQYNVRIRELTQKLAYVKTGIEEIEREPDGLTLDQCEQVNALYDQEYEINEAISDLTREWGTRNWTGSDWSTHSLVMQNID